MVIVVAAPPDPAFAPRFPLGRTCATPGVLADVSHDDIVQALRAHQAGQWGELDPEDIDANERALLDGSRLLSCYPHPAVGKFWIITEWDRSLTTVLLPEEY